MTWVVSFFTSRFKASALKGEHVAVKYKGVVEGRHGTDRNVSAFVEMEWGAKAYALMWRLKALF